MRVVKWFGWTVLILAAVLTLFVAFGLNALKGPITRAVDKATGRELTIGGRLKVVWSAVHPRFRAEKVSFTNADWANEDDLFRADAVEASVELLPLFAGRVVVPDVHLVRPELNLEIDADGRKNWILDKEGKKDGSRIFIRALTLDRARLRYEDAIRDISVDAQLSSDAQGIAAVATGTYRGVRASARGRGGPVLSLKDSGKPYPLNVIADVGSTTVKADGTITNIAQLSAVDLAVEASGKTLANLYDVIGIAFPETKAYTTRGRLVRDGNMLRYEKFTARVGASDLAGTLQFDTQREPRTFMHGEVISKTLDFADLGTLVGTREPRESGVLPDMPFDSDRWDSIDADVRIKAGTIKRPEQLPIEALSTRIVMKDKVLTLDPLAFGIAGGTLDGTIRLDGNKEPIRADAAMDVRHLKLGQLFPTIKQAQGSLGDINGLVELAGSGDSVAQMLGSANGKVGLYIDGGQVSRFLMELVAIDLWGIARTKLEGDQPIPIRCAIADFAVKSGVAQTNAFVFDTQVVNVGGSGTINLQNEQLDLKLQPEPKGRSLASLNSPLYLRGTFSQPKPGADVKRIAARGAGAVIMGILNPVLAILPLLNEGKGKDSNCSALIDEATSPARSAASGATAKRPPSRPAR